MKQTKILILQKFRKSSYTESMELQSCMRNVSEGMVVSPNHSVHFAIQLFSNPFREVSTSVLKIKIPGDRIKIY